MDTLTNYALAYAADGIGKQGQSNIPTVYFFGFPQFRL